MSRKDTLRAMLGQRVEKLPDGNPTPPTVPPSDLQHVRSGAVGAMGRSLGRIASEAASAKALIAAGDAVIEIATDKLVPSFVADRFAVPAADPELVESIRERGQQVPILVRPHPETPGSYQIAYGHRRFRALAELGRPARAVVKELSDEDLVVAQGQENSARTDLSYIERARFALALTDRGFDRGVVMAALNMEKTQLSRLLSIGRAIPREVADAIGPAPKAGRPRWEMLAEKLKDGSRDAVVPLFADPKFLAADTDGRFNRVLAVVTAKPTKEKPTLFKNEAGEKIASIKRGEGSLSVVIGASEFGEYVAEQLPELYRAFRDRAA